MTDRPKRPAYQWYPGDFRRDLAVQACSFEARALWREMLDLMHDGEPYGHLTAGGVPLTAAQLSRMIPGTTPRKVATWLEELESYKVFSRTEMGAIYSRRMLRDNGTYAEYVAKQTENGKRGGRPRKEPQPETQAFSDGNPNETQTKPNTNPEITSAVCSLQSSSSLQTTNTPNIGVGGKNGDAHASPEIPPFPAPAAKGPRRQRAKMGADAQRVLEHYFARHPTRKPFSAKNIARVETLLHTYSPAELIQAIDGNADDDWHREVGKHALEYVFRNNGTIDDFRAKAKKITDAKRPILETDPARAWALGVYGASPPS